MNNKQVRAADKLERARDIAANAERIAANMKESVAAAEQQAIAAGIAYEIDGGSKSDFDEAVRAERQAKDNLADAVHKLDRKQQAVTILEQRYAESMDAATAKQDAVNKDVFNQAAGKYAKIFGELSEASRELGSVGVTLGAPYTALADARPQYRDSWQYLEQLRANGCDVPNPLVEPSSGPQQGFDSGF